MVRGGSSQLELTQRQLITHLINPIKILVFRVFLLGETSPSMPCNFSSDCYNRPGTISSFSDFLLFHAQAQKANPIAIINKE